MFNGEKGHLKEIKGLVGCELLLTPGALKQGSIRRQLQ